MTAPSTPTDAEMLDWLTSQYRVDLVHTPFGWMIPAFAMAGVIDKPSPRDAIRAAMDAEAGR